MTPLQWAIWWSIAIFSIFASALASGLEIGLYSMNRVRLHLRASAAHDRSAIIIAEEIARPERLIIVLLILNNIVNFLAASATARLMEASGYSAASIALLNALVLSPVLFVAGEALPKEYFRQEADRATPFFAAPLRAVRLLLTMTGVLPLVMLIASFARRILSLPQSPQADERARIVQLLQEGAGQGLLSDVQVSLVDRAIAYRAVSVKDQLVPWNKVEVVPANSERSRMLDIIGTSAHACFPAVDRVGKVVGVLRLIDLYTHAKKAPSELIKPVVRLELTTSAQVGLTRLRRAGATLGVVEDASGKPLGIVTARDLVEPLTGELAGL